jgi:hypothetical protein
MCDRPSSVWRRRRAERIGRINHYSLVQRLPARCRRFCHRSAGDGKHHDVGRRNRLGNRTHLRPMSGGRERSERCGAIRRAAPKDNIVPGHHPFRAKCATNMTTTNHCNLHMYASFLRMYVRRDQLSLASALLEGVNRLPNSRDQSGMMLPLELGKT